MASRGDPWLGSTQYMPETEEHDTDSIWAHLNIVLHLRAASQVRSALTALPLGVAHPQVTAHAGRALLGTVGAADLLNLLSQGLEGGVDLHVAIAHHVGVVSAVVATTVGIGGLLLNRLADEVESTTRSSRGSSRSGRSGRTLFQKTSDIYKLQTHSKYLIETEIAARLTAGPISPLRPRGPGGPMGPGRPFMPSLPGAPLVPAGPY